MKETAQENAAQNESERAQRATRRKLAEMNLLDNFLFGAVVSYPEIGEEFVRILLRILFGREFGRLSVTGQKVFYGTDTDLHGARLDVYTEPETEEGSGGQAAIYDIEPDRKDGAKDVKALPRRVRFYHATIGTRNLRSGADYGSLKNVMIIMILPFDPFGLDRMVYTVKNRCVEVPDMSYEDGTATLFLYTRGTEGVPNEAVGQLLRYLEDTTYENAVNGELRRIHGMVETVKGDSEIMLAHLRMIEDLNRSRKEGEAIGETRGEIKVLVSQVCRKLKKKKSPEEIAEDLEEELSVIEPICNAAREFAPDYDPEAVLERMDADGQGEST